MKTSTTLKAVATAMTLVMTMGLSVAAHAGDFDDNYPLFEAGQQAQKATPDQAAARRVAATAATVKPQPGQRVSSEASRALAREDSGSFWMTQHPAHPRSAAAVARLESGTR
jgi:uncharacterized membrane protein